MLGDLVDQEVELATALVLPVVLAPQGHLSKVLLVATVLMATPVAEAAAVLVPLDPQVQVAAMAASVNFLA